MKVSLAFLVILSIALSSIIFDIVNAYSPPVYPSPPIRQPPPSPIKRSPPPPLKPTLVFSPSPPAKLPPGYCQKKCGVRCSKAGKQSRCARYCLMCCDRCKCVPPGTYGNKDHCPCYRDWKSPVTGRAKCP